MKEQPKIIQICAADRSVWGLDENGNLLLKMRGRGGDYWLQIVSNDSERYISGEK